MRRFFINFRNNAREHAAELSARAYNHYKRFTPLFTKFSQPIKKIHNKYIGKFNNQNSKS